MISVVVASCRSEAQLSQTLASLIPQCDAAGAELLVARSAPDGSDPSLPLGTHRVVACARGASIPEIRGAGLRAASGEWVAVTEDNCVAAPDWLEALISRCAAPAQVVGGTMFNARPERGIDAGAAFAEYGFFGPCPLPHAEGSPPLVTGANVAYHRSVLPEVTTRAVAGEWEDQIHHRLAAAGTIFALARHARIGQNLTYGGAAFCRDRYEHGRDYARVRGRAHGGFRRLGLAATTPLLPIVLGARIWRSSGRSDPRAFVRAAPWMATFLAAWAAGEFVGYLSPDAGDEQ